MQPTIINPQEPQAPAPAAPVLAQMPPQGPTVVTSGYAPAAEQASAGKAPRGIFGKVIVGVVLLVAFAGGYFVNTGVSSLSQSQATASAKAFIAALNAGNSAKAYKLGSANLRSQQTESQFASAVDGLQSTKPSFSNQATTFDGSTAYYTATESGLPADINGNTSGNFTLALVKDGLVGWKVDSITVQ